MSIADDIMRDYPTLAWLVNDPEIGPLLQEAVDPNKGFDAATFQAKLEQTNWWKTHSDSERQWQVLYNTDRAEYDRQITARHAELLTTAAQLGFQVPDKALWDITEQSLSKGLSSSSAEVKGMLSWYSPTGSQPVALDLKKIAHDDYLMPLDDGVAGAWSREIAAGRATEDQFRQTMMYFSEQRFPSIADQIKNGTTPGQLFGVQRSAIASELEVDPSSIDLVSDPRWSQVLGVSDGKGGTQPMTYSDAIKLARSQPEWGKTTKANQLASDLGLQLLQTFGAVKT